MKRIIIIFFLFFSFISAHMIHAVVPPVPTPTISALTLTEGPTTGGSYVGMIGSGFTKSTVFRPRKAHAAVYSELYRLYRQLHDAFGSAGYDGPLCNVMKDLIAIRNRVRRGGPADA